MSCKEEARQLATRVVMMPRDTNGLGKIFGGVLLSNIDIAAAIVARQASADGIIHRMVTRAMDRVEFKHPVHVNDILTCYGRITGVGQTSITVHVEVEVDRLGEIIEVTEADVVYVAVNDDGRPVRINAAAGLPRQRWKHRQANSGTKGGPGEARRSARRRDSRRILALRKTMMPHETNGFGSIFGGVLLSHIDLAGSVVAKQACSNAVIARCVTRAMDQVEFTQPVYVNDVLSCYGTVTSIGTTSIHVHVDVEVDRNGVTIPVTSADLVFVAVDKDGRPMPVACTSQKRNRRKPSKRARGRRKDAARQHDQSPERGGFRGGICRCPE